MFFGQIKDIRREFEMGKQQLGIIGIIVLFLALTATAALASEFPIGAAEVSANHEDGQLRVIAKTSSEALKALEAGCAFVKNVKGLEVFKCKKSAARTVGLEEDMKLHALDYYANAHVRADALSSPTQKSRDVLVRAAEEGIWTTSTVFTDTLLHQTKQDWIETLFESLDRHSARERT